MVDVNQKTSRPSSWTMALTCSLGLTFTTRKTDLAIMAPGCGYRGTRELATTLEGMTAAAQQAMEKICPYFIVTVEVEQDPGRVSADRSRKGGP